ncbi:hypothetical protein LSA36186_08600 [Lachnoanaerobaculum sp. JCM 36186]|nr:hypothetical protein LSA36186_08600 [Lachnoanaerobaculum sp. JCM 36186]
MYQINNTHNTLFVFQSQLTLYELSLYIIYGLFNNVENDYAILSAFLKLIKNAQDKSLEHQ